MTKDVIFDIAKILGLGDLRATQKLVITLETDEAVIVNETKMIIDNAATTDK